MNLNKMLEKKTLFYESPWGKKKPSSNSGNNDENKFYDAKKVIHGIFSKTKHFGKNNNNGSGGDHDSKFMAKIFYFIFGIISLLWLASGFYIVQPDEQALVMRFGKFLRIADPGPNYHLPAPIEVHTIHKVTLIRREEIGFRSVSSDFYNKSSYFSQANKSQDNNIKSIIEESMMLTGDENLAEINFIVQWKIKSLANYALNIIDPDKTVKIAAESSMREIIGNTKLTDAQTDGRAKVEIQAKDLLQNILDEYESGVEIVNLQMLKIDPPQEVIDAFRDVQTARSDKERIINQAYAYRNDILPKARGQASKITQEAEAYKATVIAQSIGNSERFNSIYQEYKIAKDVTKKRIYFETMEGIFQDINKIIIDNNNVLTYLPLDSKNITKGPNFKKESE